MYLIHKVAVGSVVHLDRLHDCLRRLRSSEPERGRAEVFYEVAVGAAFHLDRLHDRLRRPGSSEPE